MKVKMILPALAEAESPFWRPIKYSLFPPLGLATLAAYLSLDDEVDLQDQHVETLNLDDNPDLVIIQVYITNAYRAYKIADQYRARGAGRKDRRAAVCRGRPSAGQPACRPRARIRQGDGGDGRAQPCGVQHHLAGHQQFS